MMGVADTQPELAESAVRGGRREFRTRTVAGPAAHVSPWARLAIAVRLFMRAKETSLEVESVAPQRRREVGRKRWCP